MLSLYRRQMLSGEELQPENVGPQAAMTDYEFGFAERAVSCDDFIAFSAAWRGVPWLEACCGYPVHCAEGSLAPGAFVESLEQLAELPIPGDNGWLACLLRQTGQLLATAPAIVRTGNGYYYVSSDSVGVRLMTSGLTGAFI